MGRKQSVDIGDIGYRIQGNNLDIGYKVGIGDRVDIRYRGDTGDIEGKSGRRDRNG